jgi:hypothetical protein
MRICQRHRPVQGEDVPGDVPGRPAEPPPFMRHLGHRRSRGPRRVAVPGHGIFPMHRCLSLRDAARAGRQGIGGVLGLRAGTPKDAIRGQNTETPHAGKCPRVRDGERRPRPPGRLLRTLVDWVRPRRLRPRRETFSFPEPPAPVRGRGARVGREAEPRTATGSPPAAGALGSHGIDAGRALDGPARRAPAGAVVPRRVRTRSGRRLVAGRAGGGAPREDGPDPSGEIGGAGTHRRLRFSQDKAGGGEAGGADRRAGWVPADAEGRQRQAGRRALRGRQGQDALDDIRRIREVAGR